MSDPTHPCDEPADPLTAQLVAEAQRERYQGMACPHCGSYCRARSGRTLSPLYRERVYQCDNAACGHVFVVGMEVLRTLSPSAMPNKSIQIPLTRAAYQACGEALESGDLFPLFV